MLVLPGTAAPADVDRLVAEAVAGVSGARDQLLVELRPIVLRYCQLRFGQRDTIAGSAEDIAQEVCLAVVAALPVYQVSGASFRAFVIGIAKHKVMDAYRSIGRNRCDPVPELPDRPSHDVEPEQHALAGDLAARLRDLLDLLTPRQREVLVLRVVRGLSTEEVALLTGSTPVAVRVAQHRALNRLRAEIAAARGVPAGPLPPLSRPRPVPDRGSPVPV